MLVAGNWKMYKGPAEAAEFCLGLREQELDGVDVVVCPPFVSLAVAVQLLAGTEIAVAGTPSRTRASFTAFARRSDSAML